MMNRVAQMPNAAPHHYIVPCRASADPLWLRSSEHLWLRSQRFTEPSLQPWPMCNHPMFGPCSECSYLSNANPIFVSSLHSAQRPPTMSWPRHSPDGNSCASTASGHWMMCSTFTVSFDLVIQKASLSLALR